MTVVSKHLFYEKIGPHLSCKDLHYWNPNCLWIHSWMVKIVFLGSMKFFLPIYIIKAIINYKKFKDKTFWRSLITQQLRSTLYGILLANIFLSTNCLLCKISGRINYYNLALIPGIFSGLSVLVETKENHLLDTIIFFNLLVEAALRNLDDLNIFQLTDVTTTLMFMGVSSMLMHCLQNREKKDRFIHFWFYSPPRFEKNTEINSKISRTCQFGHKESCKDYAIKGVGKYFMLGYLFSIVRKLIPVMLQVFQKPSKLYDVAMNTDNVKFGAFIGVYVAVHRYVMCYLLRTKQFDQKYLGAIAGLISGATFSISPNMQVLSVAITTVLQVLYNNAVRQLSIKNTLIPQQLIYMLAHSLLIHNAIMNRRTCPAYYLNMLKICTSDLFPKLYEHLIGKYILHAPV